MRIPEPMIEKAVGNKFTVVNWQLRMLQKLEISNLIWVMLIRKCHRIKLDYFETKIFMRQKLYSDVRNALLGAIYIRRLKNAAPRT